MGNHAFIGPTKVVEVRFNYDGGYCSVNLEEHNLDGESKEEIESILSSYEESNWLVEE